MRTGSYVIVGILAAATWWLASRNSRSVDATVRRSPSPGYYFKNATLTETDAAGKINLTLVTRAAQQNPDTRLIQLSDIQVDYQTQDDARWQLTADEGSMPTGANVLTLRGHVVMHAVGGSAQGAVIRTDTLSLDRAHHVASTVNPAMIEWAPHQLSARGFRLDLTRKTLELENAVHGTFRR
jgi:LPS export ABC transporter protein LptC